MLFADVSLAARIERADSRFLQECVEAIARRRPDRDVLVRTLAGGVAAFTAAESPLNKLAGLSFDGPLDEYELAEVERAFAERGAPLQAEVSNLADGAICALLTQRGYVLRNFENVLGRALPLSASEESDSVSEIEVSVAAADGFEAWLDTIVTGFANPDTQGVESHKKFSREGG